MTANKSHLRMLREKTGLSLRELARQISEQPTNVSYWERTGHMPHSDVLIPIAQALGVTVEELLGAPKPRCATAPAGKMRQLFESVSRLPRSQQQKVLDILQPFVREHVNQEARA